MIHDMMSAGMIWGMGLIGLLLALTILALGRGLFRRGPVLALLLAAAPLAATERPANFALHDEARPVPAIAFVDDEARTRTLADFKGKAVLLNLWATWCAPCRKEMPALDRLQSALGGPDFEVVALSLDRAGVEPVRRFYRETGVKEIAIYLDASGKALRDLKVTGLPTTLLIDRDGRELGRLIGPAEWDALEMVAFLRARIGLSSQ